MQTSKGNEGSKVITIYDIAKEAGVSAATVSRVLTKSANVRPEKKEKVMELVRKYNFKPNALAKGLADTKSKVIGILTADVRNPYYAELFVACEQAARKAGYSVLLFNTMGEMCIRDSLCPAPVSACLSLKPRSPPSLENLQKFFALFSGVFPGTIVDK